MEQVFSSLKRRSSTTKEWQIREIRGHGRGQWHDCEETIAELVSNLPIGGIQNAKSKLSKAGVVQVIRQSNIGGELRSQFSSRRWEIASSESIQADDDEDDGVHVVWEYKDDTKAWKACDADRSAFIEHLVTGKRSGWHVFQHGPHEYKLHMNGQVSQRNTHSRRKRRLRRVVQSHAPVVSGEDVVADIGNGNESDRDIVEERKEEVVFCGDLERIEVIEEIVLNCSSLSVMSNKWLEVTDRCRVLEKLKEKDEASQAIAHLRRQIEKLEQEAIDIDRELGDSAIPILDHIDGFANAAAQLELHKRVETQITTRMEETLKGLTGGAIPWSKQNFVAWISITFPPVYRRSRENLKAWSRTDAPLSIEDVSDLVLEMIGVENRLDREEILREMHSWEKSEAVDEDAKTCEMCHENVAKTSECGHLNNICSECLSQIGGCQICRSEPTCVVCWEAAKTHAVTPCGHKCLCTDCAGSMQDGECPICRGHVDGVIRIFDE